MTTCHALNVNYLIGGGPTKDGEFVAEIYKNIAIVGEWMKVNRAAVTKAKSLPPGESASVPATALGQTRYLFVQANNKGKYAEDLLPATDEGRMLKRCRMHRLALQPITWARKKALTTEVLPLGDEQNNVFFQGE